MLPVLHRATAQTHDVKHCQRQHKWNQQNPLDARYQCGRYCQSLTETVKLSNNLFRKIIPREAKGYSFGLIGLYVRPSVTLFFFDFVRL